MYLGFPYFLFFKNILDPKCNIKLTVDKGTLDKHKASSVADPLHNIPLPPLKDLPEQPNILKGFLILQSLISQILCALLTLDVTLLLLGSI